jgi:PIN domain
VFYIFVDTASYESEGFGFETSAALISLANAVDDGHVTVLITQITEREIQRRLVSRVSNAVAKIKGLYDLRVLRILDFEPWKNLDSESATKDALAQWDLYRTSLRPIVVEIDKVLPSHIMDAFFESRAPFSSKKPAEFRDAFVLAAVRAWAESQDHQVIVVSADPDHQHTCDGTRLLHAKGITEALAQTMDDEQMVMAARAKLEDEREGLLEKVGELLSELSINIEDDYEAEVEDIQADEISLESDDFELVEIRSGVALLSGPMKVQLSANATVADYDNGSHAEGDWVYLPYNDVTYTKKIHIRVVIRFPFEGAPPSFGSFSEVSIEEPLKLSLSSENCETTIRRGWADDGDID